MRVIGHLIKSTCPQGVIHRSKTIRKKNKVIFMFTTFVTHRSLTLIYLYFDKNFISALVKNTVQQLY